MPRIRSLHLNEFKREKEKVLLLRSRFRSIDITRYLLSLGDKILFLRIFTWDKRFFSQQG